MKDKIIGILGGMGPEATNDLFANIIRETPATRNEDHIRIIIDSNPKIPSRQKAILEGAESPVPAMIETARNLERAGADFIIIAANTPHYFHADVQNAVKIPVLHIIEEAVKETLHVVPNLTRVGVLATSAANRAGIYRKACEKYGVDVVEVPDEIQKQVQESIWSFKFDGKTQENVKLMTEATEYLICEGAQAIIMGCTEIPLIIGQENLPTPMINPNQIIAKVAVKLAKGITSF